MTQKGSGLAARFRRAMAREEEARRREEDEKRRRLEAARAARAALLDELATFAKETGFLQAERAGDGLTLRYRERFLHFEARGPADQVQVEFEGAPDEEHVLYREAQLDDRWVWVRRKRSREDRMPLFDQGLEELLIRALGLPRPEDGEPDGEGGPRRQL